MAGHVPLLQQQARIRPQYPRARTALPLGFFPPLIPRVVRGEGHLLAAPCFSELAPAAPHLLVPSGQRLGEEQSAPDVRRKPCCDGEG